MIDLSIVIVTWKMNRMLEELLSSIVRHTRGITYELIIVDNHSEDGTVEMVRHRCPDAVLIENSKNRGVAPSRNQALRITKGRYALFLDADMALVENSLEQMVAFMDRNKDAGICGCKLIGADQTVQPSARRYPSPLAFLMRRLDFLPVARQSSVLNHHEMKDWDREDIRDVDYVIGACQMIRREAIIRVGYLDEKIFYGPEDIDYCIRMYRAGWKVYYCPQTRIIHYEQRMTKKKAFSKMTLVHLSAIIYLFVKYRGKLSRGPCPAI